MQSDKQITSVAEDMSDAADKYRKLRDLTEWLTVTAESDAMYHPYPNGGLYKHDLNAIQFLYFLPNPNITSVTEFFQNLRSKPADAINSNRVCRTFVFLLDYDEIYIEDLKKLLEKELKLNFEARILSEFIIFDISKARYEKLLGGKVQDKQLRKILEKGCLFIENKDANVKQEIINKQHEFQTQLEHLKIQQNKKQSATAVRIILFVNIFIFIIDYFISLKIGIKPIEEFGIQSNQAVLNGQWWRLITSIFLHDDIQHLTGNMFMLFFLNRILKNYYNNTQYWIIYMFSGIVGSILTLFIGEYVFSLGASGAIMGLGGALFFMMFFGKNAKILRHISNTATIIIIVLYNLIYGLMEKGVNNYAHFGGFVAGICLAFIIQFITSKKANKE